MIPDCIIVAILLFMVWSEYHGFKVVVAILHQIVLNTLHEPTALGQLTQIGDNMPTNNSIVAGTSGVFQSGQPLPAGTAFAPGNPPTYAASDPSIVLTPAVDGSTVSVAVPAGSTLTSFNLQESYTRKSDGVVIQGPPLTVTVIPAAPAEPSSLGPMSQLS